MKSKSLLWSAIVVASMQIMLSGCSGISAKPEYITFNIPEGKATAVVHNQWGPSVFAGLDKDGVYLNYIVKGEAPSDRQKADVEGVEKGCREVASLEQANPLVTATSKGLLMGGLAMAHGPLSAALNSAYKGVESANSAGLASSFFLGTFGTNLFDSGGSYEASVDNCGVKMLQDVYPESEVFVLQRAPYN